MRFVHRDDPQRTATVEPAPGPALVLHHTDARGKRRRKTFKAGGKRKDDMVAIWYKLLRFASKEGWTAPEPQDDGPLTWLTFHHLDSYGTLAFTLDRKHGCAWLYQWRPGAFLARVERGTCAETELDVRPIARVRALDCCADGNLYATLSTLKRGRSDTPAWLLPAEGKSSLNIVRLDPDLSPTMLANIHVEDWEHTLDGLSVSDTGLVLGPHLEGAAIYQADGAVLETYAVGSMDHWYGRGALSANGRWMALTCDDRHVRTIDRESGAETLAGPFDQVLRVEVFNDGTTWIHGLGPQVWGIYRARPGALELVSDKVHAEVSPSGTRILEVAEGKATLHAIGEDTPLGSVSLPMLIGKHGRSRFWDEDHVVVRMGGHTPLLELDLSKL